jgi:hypothetical protein
MKRWKNGKMEGWVMAPFGQIKKDWGNGLAAIMKDWGDRYWGIG